MQYFKSRAQVVNISKASVKHKSSVKEEPRKYFSGNMYNTFISKVGGMLRLNPVNWRVGFLERILPQPCVDFLLLAQNRDLTKKKTNRRDFTVML